MAFKYVTPAYDAINNEKFSRKHTLQAIDIAGDSLEITKNICDASDMLLRVEHLTNPKEQVDIRKEEINDKKGGRVYLWRAGGLRHFHCWRTKYAKGSPPGQEVHANEV